MPVDDIAKTLGVSDNCNPSWNILLREIENGYHGLWRLALKVWNSLSKSEAMQSHTEDMLQEAILEVYQNINSWDQERDPVAWASVVMRNRLINLLKQQERQELDRLDAKARNAMVEEEQGYESVELAPEVEALRATANKATRKVLDKILNDEPLNATERQRLKRFRDFIRSHGVVATCDYCQKPEHWHPGGVYCPVGPGLSEQGVHYAV